VEAALQTFPSYNCCYVTVRYRVTHSSYRYTQIFADDVKEVILMCLHCHCLCEFMKLSSLLVISQSIIKDITDKAQNIVQKALIPVCCSKS